MSVQQSSRVSGRRWVLSPIEASVVLLIVGSLIAVLSVAVARARNEAHSSGTT